MAIRKKPKELPVSESQVEVTHLVLPSDANALGNIFGGTLVSWIDLAASIAASRHSREICVTASIDDLDFIHPIKVGHIVVLQATVNFAGKTSMEIGVRVESENPLTGQRLHTNTAYVTFVAIDREGRPTTVPQVVPKTEDEKRRFAEAQERRERRLARVRR